MATRKYRKSSCHTTKRAALRKAKSMRNKGNTAQVKKSGKGYCVWSAGKRRKVKLRTGQTLSGTRRRRRRRA